MKPISGKKIFNALKDKECIVLAANIRIVPGVARGIFRAAKDMDAALLVELARTECNQHVGYTGLTPETYSKHLLEVNEEVGHDIWALHADHIGIKTGKKDDMDDTKEMIDMQISSGYTSFAIDASHLFNFEGKTFIRTRKFYPINIFLTESSSLAKDNLTYHFKRMFKLQKNLI